MQLQPYICSMDLGVMCLVQDEKESLLIVLVIDTPNPVHTHCRSSLYIYSVSVPATVASDHKDVAPALYMLSWT